MLAVSIALAGCTLMARQDADLAIEQSPFRVYSAFWPNVHHVLWAEAWARRAASDEKPAGSLPEPLTADDTDAERRAWAAAVSHYDRELADLHLMFEMAPIRTLLIAVKGDLPSTGLSAAHREALAAAAPVYRKYWWPAHDRANRAWVADTMTKVASLTPEVPDRLARLSGTPWFANSLRVDVVRVGGREGAYTSMQPAPGHITIASSHAALQGWMAAEVLLHEATHLLFLPVMQAFSAELKAQGKFVTTGRPGSRNIDVWHVALFYMTGEVVRQALAARGIAYEPYMYKTGLLDRAWPHFRKPIETSWRAYVYGEFPRDEAIKQVVAAIR